MSSITHDTRPVWTAIYSCGCAGLTWQWAGFEVGLPAAGRGNEEIYTDRRSTGGNAIAYVRLSVSTLTFELSDIWPRSFAYV